MAGNGLVTRKEFDPYNGQLNRITTGIEGQQALTRDLHYRYDGMNNVTSREDRVLGVTDSYSYDSFDRITGMKCSLESGKADKTKRYQYDLYGNITYKSDAGEMAYDNSNNRLQSLTKTNGTEKEYRYDANGNMTQAGDKATTWTSFNKAQFISRTIKSQKVADSTFDYDANHKRIKQTSRHYANDSIELNGRTKETLYIGKGFEKVTTTNGIGQKTVEVKHHIYAGGKIVATQTHIVDSTEAEKNATPDKTHYLHGDALGSIDTITDSHGKIVQRVAFDPFGKRTQGDGTALSDPQSSRGYTGHEHMDGLGLINMNARLYDSEIGRFLSPDTFIQAATLSQSYNRYAYVMNNPLKYTDPSGHLLRLIGKLIGGLIGVAGRLITGATRLIGRVITSIGRIIKRHLVTIVTIAVAIAVAYYLGPKGIGLIIKAWKLGAVAGAAGGFAGGLASGGGLKAAIQGAIIGGITGAVAGYIGHGFGGANAVGRFGTGHLKNFAHGISQGAIAKLRGGDFKSGFIGAIVGGYAGKIGARINATTLAAKTAIASVVGGLASKAAGGKFADGAVSAAFRYLFNDLLSDAGVSKALGRLATSSAKFRNILHRLNNGKRDWVIKLGSGVDEFGSSALLGGTGIIGKNLGMVVIDPSQFSTYDFIAKNGQPMPITLEAVLAHELGHAYTIETQGYLHPNIAPDSYQLEATIIQNEVMMEVNPNGLQRSEYNFSKHDGHGLNVR